MEDIFGIDPNDSVTPIDVRNALVECFISAHGKEVAKSFKISSDKASVDALIRENIITFLRDLFHKVHGDFDSPTKDQLSKVVQELKAFSSKFRGQNIIEKHASAIQRLIDRLD